MTTLSAPAGRADALALDVPQRKSRSLWYDAWQRLIRNRAAVVSMVVIVLLYAIAYFAPLLAPYNPNRVFPGATLKEPGWTDAAGHHFILGTDPIGRDLLSRLIYGTRISMVVGIIPVTIVLIIGCSYGMLAGMRGGQVDNLMMRFAEIVASVPDLLLLIMFSIAFRETFFGRLMDGLALIFVVLAVVGWVGTARMVRGQVLQLKEKEFVEAARAIGTPGAIIAFRHILPNVLSPLIVGVAFAIPGAIFGEAGLSFLGIGIRPPTASWGSMIQTGLPYILSAWWLTAAPAAMIGIVMLAFTFLGDGLRDALDPRLK